MSLEGISSSDKLSHVLNKQATSEKILRKTIADSPFWKLIGMKLVGREKNRTILELRVKSKNLNAYRKLHGGVIASLIDSAIGEAAHNCALDGFGTNTAQLSVHYLRPVQNGEILRADAEIIHVGKILMMGKCKILNEKGRVVAFGSASLIILSIDDGAVAS